MHDGWAWLTEGCLLGRPADPQAGGAFIVWVALSVFSSPLGHEGQGSHPALTVHLDCVKAMLRHGQV